MTASSSDPAETPETAAAEVPARAPFEPREGVPAVITDAATLTAYADRVRAGSGPLALDAERASGYRYSQRAYLVQVRREGAGTALIDPIAVPDLTPLQDASVDVEWILHAATQDLPCLAELGLRPSALFDTELAGRLLGRERVSLAALVQSELGEVLEKGHGATDWSVRPLSSAQLRYAALDVELLVELRDAMAGSLAEAGKERIAREEFEALLSFAPRERGEDEWRRTSGIHRIRKPRTLAVVRALWLTRDAIAQQRDVAVGRLLPDAAIVAAAQAAPESMTALGELKEFNGRGAHRYLSRWWAAIADAYALPADALPASSTPPTGPPPPRSWADRDPEAFARLSTARSGLAAVAEGLGMPVENVISPEAVRRLCWTPPDAVSADTVAGALRAQGARPWQIEATCACLCEALLHPSPPADAPGVTGQ